MVTPPELLVPIANSQGPVAHSKSPCAHAADTCTTSAYEMPIPKPLVPSAVCLPNDKTTTPCGARRACSHAALRADGRVTSSGYTSRPLTYELTATFHAAELLVGTAEGYQTASLTATGTGCLAVVVGATGTGFLVLTGFFGLTGFFLLFLGVGGLVVLAGFLLATVRTVSVRSLSASAPPLDGIALTRTAIAPITSGNTGFWNLRTGLQSAVEPRTPAPARNPRYELCSAKRP